MVFFFIPTHDRQHTACTDRKRITVIIARTTMTIRGCIGALSPENCHLNSEVRARSENGRLFFFSLAFARTHPMYFYTSYCGPGASVRASIGFPETSGLCPFTVRRSRIKSQFRRRGKPRALPAASCGPSLRRVVSLCPSHPVYRVPGNGRVGGERRTGGPNAAGPKVRRRSPKAYACETGFRIQPLALPKEKKYYIVK